MPAQPLSADQKADAARLKAIYESKKRELRLTQDSLATACGWESQGTVSQYLNGKIPLNLASALKFSEKLECAVSDFSPRLAKALLLVNKLKDLQYFEREDSNTEPAPTSHLSYISFIAPPEIRIGHGPPSAGSFTRVIRRSAIVR